MEKWFTVDDSDEVWRKNYSFPLMLKLFSVESDWNMSPEFSLNMSVSR